jgi:hypothetical protein
MESLIVSYGGRSRFDKRAYRMAAVDAAKVAYKVARVRVARTDSPEEAR